MLIDLSPLLRGERGDAILVAGVRVGEAAKNIDRDVVTDAEVSGPGEPTPEPSRASVRLSLHELRERVDATIQLGGLIRCGEIELSVEEGVIARIVIRGPSLASLGIARQEDIADRFGPAAGHTDEQDRRLHHYPAQDLVIAWASRQGRIEHITLGGDRPGEPRFGAKDLLAEILRVYGALQPTGWAEPPGGSVRVRYRRIAALARALELGTVRNVVDGRFLEHALDAGRRAVLEEIAVRREGPDEDLPPRWVSAKSLFTHLLAYRHDVDRVVSATSGWLVCGDPILLGMIATQDRLGCQIEAMMVDVDRWLCTLLAPARQTFGLRDLVARHGWPEGDPGVLELDEI